MKEANEESRTTIAAVREEAIINVLEPIKANIDKNSQQKLWGARNEVPRRKAKQTSKKTAIILVLIFATVN